MGEPVAYDKVLKVSVYFNGESLTVRRRILQSSFRPACTKSR